MLCQFTFPFPVKIHPDSSTKEKVYVIGDKKHQTRTKGEHNEYSSKACLYGFIRVIGQSCFNWKRRFREMIFQTKRVTSSAGGDLVYPSKVKFLNHALNAFKWIVILMMSWWVKFNANESNLWTCCQYGLPSSTETVDIPIKPKPGTQENRGWIRGWWMEPEHYKVRHLRILGHIWQIFSHSQGFTVLYLHGISNSRAYYHRIGLYKTLLGMLVKTEKIKISKRSSPYKRLY